MRAWIVGAGGAALQAWGVLKASGADDYKLAGFIVKQPPNFRTEGLQIRDEDEFLANGNSETDVVSIAVGNPILRKAIADRFLIRGFRLVNLIHPSVIIGDNITIGAGVIITSGAILESNLNIGDCVIINNGAILSHECAIGSFSNIGPGVCLPGKVKIGEYCDIGAGVVARPNTAIGDNVTVGAGAVLIRDCLIACTLIGVPARPI